jgi:hypothetical protein
MSKKYTAKEVNYILKSVLGNAYEYIETILQETRKINPDNVDINALSPENKSHLRFLNMNLTLVNDIIHPAHKISYQYFNKYGSMIDWYVQNQQIAFNKKIVPACYAQCCDPDGKKSEFKAEEMRKKIEEYEAMQKGSSH